MRCDEQASPHRTLMHIFGNRGNNERMTTSPLLAHGAPSSLVRLGRERRAEWQGGTVYRKGISMNRKLLPMLVCGLLVHPALCGCSPQDKAVGWERVPAEIRTLGGIALVDEKSPGRPVTVSFMGATGAFDFGLRHLREIRQLNHLDLSHTLVSDHGLEHLKGLTELQVLHLTGTKVTDAGLENLKGLTKLQRLHLDEAKYVTGAGLKHLKGLTQLQWLYLEQTSVTDAGLEHLKGLKQLSGLRLGGTKVTGAGVQDLQKALPNVEISR
jgi:hypothetical protein